MSLQFTNVTSSFFLKSVYIVCLKWDSGTLVAVFCACASLSVICYHRAQAVSSVVEPKLCCYNFSNANSSFLKSISCLFDLGFRHFGDSLELLKKDLRNLELKKHSVSKNCSQLLPEILPQMVG